MTNPYDVYEKSTYQKVSQMRGWDSGGDFAVSFGCESCFSSETQSLCVAQSKSVPNMVVIMRIFREKWLRSSIGRSQGVRSPASLSKWGGEPVYVKTALFLWILSCQPNLEWQLQLAYCCQLSPVVCWSCWKWLPKSRDLPLELLLPQGEPAFDATCELSFFLCLSHNFLSRLFIRKFQLFYCLQCTS